MMSGEGVVRIYGALSLGQAHSTSSGAPSVKPCQIAAVTAAPVPGVYPKPTLRSEKPMLRCRKPGCEATSDGADTHLSYTVFTQRPVADACGPGIR
jgi:hypothetical protein